MLVLLAVVMLLWLPGFCLAFLEQLAVFVNNLHVYRWVGIGFAAYLPLHWLIVRRWHGLQTFEHELTHALFGLLFLRRIRSFVSTARRGGMVVHEGRFGGRLGDIAISLAPYVFPTFSVALVLLRPLIARPGLPYIDVAIGLSLGFHALTALSETGQAFRSRKFRDVSGRVATSDVAKHGLLFSAVYIAFFIVFYNGLLLALLNGGYAEAWVFVKHGALGGYDQVAALIAWLRNR